MSVDGAPRAVRLTDGTLRDGSHSVGHRFTVDQVQRVARALSDGGVRVIEVAHGDGLGGSSFNYGFSQTDERTLIAAAAAAVAPHTQIATLLLPGIGVAADLREAWKLGVRIVRVATHCTEADIAAQHLALARELGFEATGFLMMSHMVEPGQLAEQALLMESYGAHAVYAVDSAGALVPESAAARVRALREALRAETLVGFHAHDNLGCAVGNTLAAVAAGAALVDGSIAGLGAGAGNMATELFAAAARRSEIETGLDALALARSATMTRALLGVEPRRDEPSLVLGFAGVYSSFLLHAEHAASRFGLQAADILVELGRRGAVGGQEDMILDVAAELAARGSPAA
ncbi:4-hydroxy-2-oxovalerate aldolase [Baekduia alba]|uniref:4-hydroxy-2-oxovalerate aldolase n=1 Tax=Baekduia alba TaxID=2997333 RepID=UPI002340CE22|nr:4-hydroxy-2-oxovalerate aldolase [Baekduia alba]WCB96874.1 4-hydroxy-2-oxovalerate aldolase [Baekduia alba]